MNGIEKRGHFRKALHADAWISDPIGYAWSQVTFLDISRSGVALISLEKLADGSSHLLRFNLPGEPRQITVTGTIAHCQEHAYLPGYRAGIQFTKIEPEDVDSIEHFIEALTAA